MNETTAIVIAIGALLAAYVVSEVLDRASRQVPDASYYAGMGFADALISGGIQ